MSSAAIRLMGASMIIGVAAFAAAMALVIVPTTTYHILARVGPSVVLAKSSKWIARATETVWTDPAPLEVGIDARLLSAKISMEGESYVVPKSFLTRLRAITGP